MVFFSCLACTLIWCVSNPLAHLPYPPPSSSVPPPSCLLPPASCLIPPPSPLPLSQSASFHFHASMGLRALSVCHVGRDTLIFRLTCTESPRLEREFLLPVHLRHCRIANHKVFRFSWRIHSFLSRYLSVQRNSSLSLKKQGHLGLPLVKLQMQRSQVVL